MQIIGVFVCLGSFFDELFGDLPSYSSLAYIKKYNVGYLKIDQVFVRNLTADNDDSVICETIIAMADKLSREACFTKPAH